MLDGLPSDTKSLLAATWATYEPCFLELDQRSLTPENVLEWLQDWSDLSNNLDELFNRLQVAVAADTTDAKAEQSYVTFLDVIYPRAKAAEQALKKKLIDSGLEPAGYEIALRNMRAEADLFREENLSLKTIETKLSNAYDKVMAAQTVVWEGEEQTVDQMQTVYQHTDRQVREQAWRLVAERQLADREAINQLWGKLLDLREKMAKNAGHPNYLAYRWKEMLRFDYTPEDARRFQASIEAVVVPAAKRIYERRRTKLAVDTLRPWDLSVDPSGLPALRPFKTAQQLTDGVSSIFHQVDPTLGQQFDLLVQENLLDLENRKNKAPGGFCTDYPVIERPFIFMNAVGTHEDLQTLLHEGGHAFHAFASAHLPAFLRMPPMEFAEVASMSMELLAAPYLTKGQGGFYTEAEAARARIEHLEGAILFWPYMGVVDAFQHWAYEHPDEAANPAACDSAWGDLWQRFMQGVDWSGLEDVMETGWHRKLHIYGYPFYYIEYGLAQLGAVQVWDQALKDQAGAVTAYRRALSLGGTTTLPELFSAAGARFAFDDAALDRAVELMEAKISELQQAL